MAHKKLSVNVKALLRELRLAEVRLEQKLHKAKDARTKKKLKAELRILCGFHRKIDGNISLS